MTITDYLKWIRLRAADPQAAMENLEVSEI